jgi:uncharacterized protein (TIGR03067 family)
MYPFPWLCCIALLLGTARLPAVAQDKADAVVNELARLEGHWQIVVLAVGEKVQGFEPGDGGSFTFTGGRFTSRLPGFGEASGKVALDLKANPPRLDLVTRGGTMFVTYRLGGGALTLAVWFKAADRQGTLDAAKQDPAGMVLTLKLAPRQTGPVGTGG